MEFKKVNQNYGHSYIIKDYINLPQMFPLPFVIQHGWASVIETPDYYLNMGYKGFWVWNENSKKSLNKFIEKRKHKIIIGGAPFIYLYNSIKKPTEKKGTIVFPAHSAITVKVICDFEKFAEMLENLPEEFKPITVCIHYRDIELNNHLPFKNKGFKIVSNGNPHDYKFLIRFIKHTEDKRYSLSNKLGTSLLYSAYMGLRSYVYGPEVSFYNINDNYLPKGKITNLKTDNYIDKLKPYFKIESSQKDQKEISNIELGMPFYKSQNEIHKFMKDLIDANYFLKLYLLIKNNMDLIKIESALNKIKKYKRVIIAGAGSHTKKLISQFSFLKDIVITILDKNNEGFIEGIKVSKEESIDKYDFDAILISSKSFELKIYKRLLKLNVPYEKIFLIYNEN